MKITKSKLKQIIRESLDEVTASGTGIAGAQKGLGSGQARKDAIELGKQAGASGITPDERGLIKHLSSLLHQGAVEGNILSGVIVTKIKQLAAALQDAGISAPAGDAPPSEEGP